MYFYCLCEVQNFEESVPDTACVPVFRYNRDVATSGRRNVRNTQDSQKKKDILKLKRKTIGKMLENRANVPDNTHEDSEDKEEVSSMSSFGNDEV